MNRARALLLLFSIPLAAACDTSTDLQGPFDLTFRGRASFGGPHGGQAIEMALLDQDGVVQEIQTGTVSPTSDPAFEFVFRNALVSGESYGIRFWIDSNFDGGTVGECDPPEIDHQWGFFVSTISGNVELTAQHDPSIMTEVCDSF